MCDTLNSTKLEEQIRTAWEGSISIPDGVIVRNALGLEHPELASMVSERTIDEVIRVLQSREMEGVYFNYLLPEGAAMFFSGALMCVFLLKFQETGRVYDGESLDNLLGLLAFRCWSASDVVPLYPLAIRDAIVDFLEFISDAMRGDVDSSEETLQAIQSGIVSWSEEYKGPAPNGT